MERVCRSPSRLTDGSASSRAVFNESALGLVDCNGSNGGPFRAFSTVGKSQGGTVRECGGLWLIRRVFVGVSFTPLNANLKNHL